MNIRVTNVAGLIQSLSSESFRSRLPRGNVGDCFTCLVIPRRVEAGGDEADVTMRVKRVLKYVQ